MSRASTSLAANGPDGLSVAPPAELAAIERELGSPLASDGPFTFRRTREADEREEFPVEALAELRRLGIFDELVPVELGGRFVGPSRLIQICRLLSRRDLALAIAIGQTFLGATPVWLAGDANKRARVAAHLRAGHVGAIALTEEEHGADLLASDFAATRARGSSEREVNGRKWLINNGSRGAFFSAFARTEAAGGPRGFSLVLLDRDTLRAAEMEPLPKIRTHGIRSADISGFAMRGALLDEACIIGPEGSGLELTLKTLQITRTLCGGFSLGAADTALRTTLRFVLGRELYGRPLSAMGHVRASLAEAYALLLAAEAVARRACRTLELVPAEGAIASSVTKVVVPVLVEEIVAIAARVLGARSYLRDTHESGVFEKLRRDVAVVSLFDGSVPVNLAALAAQLPVLAARRGRETDRRPTADGAGGATAFASDRMRIGAVSDQVVAAVLGRSIESTRAPDLRASVVQAVHDVDAAIGAVGAAGAARFPTSRQGQEIAWRYALAHATACVLGDCRDLSALGDARVVSATARAVASRLDGTAASLTDDEVSLMWDRLVRQYEDSELFSAETIRVEHS